MIKFGRLFLFGLLGLMTWSACNENYLFVENNSFESEEWTYSEQLEYEVNIADTSQLYELIISLEHSTEYPRQNLYTRITTVFPDQTSQSKPLSLELANKAGIWYGDCNGEWCEVQIPIQTNAYFSQAGTYQFKLEQFTRINPLPGIRQVGFAVKELAPR